MVGWLSLGAGIVEEAWEGDPALVLALLQITAQAGESHRCKQHEGGMGPERLSTPTSLVYGKGIHSQRSDMP